VSCYEKTGKFYGHLVYFTAIWYIAFSFGVFVAIWVYFSSFGMLYQEKSGSPGCKHGDAEKKVCDSDLEIN
jgi:hypothetical protein